MRLTIARNFSRFPAKRIAHTNFSSVVKLSGMSGILFIAVGIVAPVQCLSSCPDVQLTRATAAGDILGLIPRKSVKQDWLIEEKEVGVFDCYL